MIVAISLLVKADGMKATNKNLSFLYLSLGVNVTVLPFSLFVGGMATDSPDSGHFAFVKGFFLVQTIPVILLLVSLFKIFKYKLNNSGGCNEGNIK